MYDCGVGFCGSVAMSTVGFLLGQGLGPVRDFDRIEFLQAVKASAAGGNDDDAAADGRRGGVGEDCGRNIDVGNGEIDGYLNNGETTAVLCSCAREQRTTVGRLVSWLDEQLLR